MFLLKFSTYTMMHAAPYKAYYIHFQNITYKQHKDYGIKFRFLNKFTWTAPSFLARTFLWEYQHVTKHIGISRSNCLSDKGILPMRSFRCAALKPQASQQWIGISKANHLPSSPQRLVNWSQAPKLPSWWDSMLHSMGSRQNRRGGFQPSRPCLALLLWVVPWEITRITHSRRKLIISVTVCRILNSRYNRSLNSDLAISLQFLFFSNTEKTFYLQKL